MMSDPKKPMNESAWVSQAVKGDTQPEYFIGILNILMDK
jgi:hypothetical protein